MVGTNTALNDNPELTVRDVEGKNPIRVLIDLNLRLPKDLHLFDKKVLTIVFNYHKNEIKNNLEFIQLNSDKDLIVQILEKLYQQEIQSLIIEGGTQLLNSFIGSNTWDEARVFTGNKLFKSGLKAPQLKCEPKLKIQVDSDTLNTYING